MSTYAVLDGTGSLKYVYGLSTGTTGDPYRMVYKRYSNAIVEDGKVFTYSARISLANAATGSYLIKTLATPKFTLYELDVTSDSSPLIHDLYENTVVSANGTQVTPFNNNRTSSTTASTLLYQNPTITSNGTLLLADLVAGGKSVGSQDTGEFRIIFNPSSNYLLLVTNNSGVTADVVILMKFSET
jgi:hypothetical protein